MESLSSFLRRTSSFLLFKHNLKALERLKRSGSPVTGKENSKSGTKTESYTERISLIHLSLAKECRRNLHRSIDCHDCVTLVYVRPTALVDIIGYYYYYKFCEIYFGGEVVTKNYNQLTPVLSH